MGIVFEDAYIYSVDCEERQVRLSWTVSKMWVGSELFNVLMTWMKGHSASLSRLARAQQVWTCNSSSSSRKINAIPAPGVEQPHAPGQAGNQVVEKEC